MREGAYQKGKGWPRGMGDRHFFLNLLMIAGDSRIRRSIHSNEAKKTCCVNQKNRVGI